MKVNMEELRTQSRATWVRETVGCRRTDGRHSSSFAARSLDDRVASDEKQSSFPASCLARLPTFPVRATPFPGSFPCAIPAPSPSAPHSDGSVPVPLSASLWIAVRRGEGQGFLPKGPCHRDLLPRRHMTPSRRLQTRQPFRRPHFLLGCVTAVP